MIPLKYFARLYHLPVVEKDSGRQLGNLSDVYVFKNSGDIFAIVATNENILYRNRLIYANNIVEEKPDALLVRGFGERFASVLPVENSEIRSYKSALHNKKVVQSGEVLGKIKDCCFDFETGRMCEIELGRGLTDDLIHGRDHLKLSGNVWVMKSDVVVSDEEKLLSSGKGMKKMMKGKRT